MMIKRSPIAQTTRTITFNALITLLCLCLWTSAALAAENPKATVQAWTKQVIRLVKEYSGNPPVLRQKIRAVVDNNFDFHSIAKNALGPAWQQQSPAKRKQFTRYFSRFLFNTYIRKIEGYTNQRITYALLESQGPYALVRTTVTEHRDASPIRIDYYLHLENGNWKVQDMVIGGVGLVTNYRAQFTAILARSSFNDLLQELKNRSS